ncbi:MAG: hypothetical protein HY906_25760 [Deltaproteobacteria bacterium]|nr:hypothetical protein [Deltaproteobacteria bacterium]
MSQLATAEPPMPAVDEVPPGAPAPGPGFGERALFHVFTAAIAAEREAQELYLRAAGLAGTGTLLERMFRELAAEERVHEQNLLEQYGAFKARLGDAAEHR